jgi:sodium-dependent dicarboxylate transporter 2/3/5
VPPTIGVCLGASMAFMLPVSTPSNAIVYGSGRVPITTMLRSGLLLDLCSFVVILGGLRLLCPLLGLMPRP